MLNISIHQARPEDAKQILDYLNQIGGESDNLLFDENGFSHMTREKEAAVLRSMRKSDLNFIFIAKVNNEIVDNCSIIAFPREHLSHRAVLVFV